MWLSVAHEEGPGELRVWSPLQDLGYLEPGSPRIALLQAPTRAFIHPLNKPALSPALHWVMD